MNTACWLMQLMLTFVCCAFVESGAYDNDLKELAGSACDDDGASLRGEKFPTEWYSSKNSFE